MKKIIPAFILIAVFMVSGCAALGTTKIQYISSASSEKLCTLKITPALTVTQFNDETVNWRPFCRIRCGWVFGGLEPQGFVGR